MAVGTIVTIILVFGVGVLVFLLIKNVVLPRKAAVAKNYLNRNDLLKAIRNAKAAIEKDSQDVEAHYLLGKAYLADKRDELAFKEYRSANRLGIAGKNIPETEFRETMASLYAKFNEEEEALKEYILLIKQHPENPEYFYNAGKLFNSRGRGDLAGQYIQKAISLNPKEARYRFELGMNHYLAKRLKEASAEFDAAIKLDPSDCQALLYMGKALRDGKDYAAALPYLERAAHDQEYRLRSLVESGGCYMSLKMVDKAIQELERAVNNIVKEAEPDSLYARYFLAMCYEKTKEYAKAVAQWDKIYAQKKNFRDVGEKLAHYGEYRAETGEKESGAKS
jgi:tetratricopeptide (TPR) repeat protein